MALVPVARRLHDAAGSTVDIAAFLRELLPGRVVALHYSGEPMWMERVIICGVADGVGHDTGVWHGLTPDLDQYAEDYTEVKATYHNDKIFEEHFCGTPVEIAYQCTTTCTTNFEILLRSLTPR